MKVCLIWGVLGAAMVVGLASCATSPTQTNDAPAPALPAPKPFNEAPGDVTFGNAKADIMYEILIAEFARQRGRPDIAAKFYVDAAKQSRDPRIASRAVRIANFANNKDDALVAAKIWNEGEPENLESQRVLAVLYLRGGENEKAQVLLDRLLSADEKSVGRNLLLTGALLQRESGKEDAAKIAAYLVTLYPDQAESHYIHASLAIQADQKEAALESIEKTLEIRPEWVDAAILYPRILLENEKSVEALDYLAGYVTRNPKNNTLRLAYARFLVDERKLEEARSQFELLAVKLPNNKDVLFSLAMLAMQGKDLDEAKSYLEQLSLNGKANSQVHYYLGQIEEQKSNFKPAIKHYSKARNGEYFLESQLRIAAIIAETEGVENARVHLQSIQTQNDNEKRKVLLFEGNLLRDFKLYQASFDFYSELLIEEPKDIDYLYYRSLVAERLDLVDIVIRDLTYVVSQNPNDAGALNALGYTLADRTDRLEEALKFIQRASELEPSDAAIIDSLGWVNFRLGNHEVALEYLKKAMEQLDDGEVAAHYGEVLWAVGKTSEAISVWSKAKKQFKDNEVLKDTLRRFDQ